jgi:hypothetical protein
MGFVDTSDDEKLSFEERISAYHEEFRQSVEMRDDILFKAVFELLKGIAYPATLIGAGAASNWITSRFLDVPGWIDLIIAIVLTSLIFFAVAFHVFGVEQRVRSLMPELPEWDNRGDKF